MPVTRLVIERLGSNGEGMAMGENGPVHVPFALPGEVVNAAVIGKRADVVSLLQASPDRVAPA
ncbi:MAG: TRAM domain-containing protein, partial [Rhizobiaceae bacterium]